MNRNSICLFNKVCALSVFFLATNSCLAQKTHLVIAGKVSDKKTKVPIAYANIGVMNKGIGTVSNESGEFEFFIPVNFINDSLYISHVGYKTFGEKISKLKEQHQNIYIEETATILNDIVVSDKELTAQEIIQQIKNNITKNYPVAIYKMDAFFREIRKENNNYKSLLESAVSIYDEGYHKPKSDETVYLDEIRTSKRYINEFNPDFWNDSNLFREVLGLNALRHPNAQPDLFDKKTNYQIADVTQYIDKTVYVLVSDTAENKPWKRKIYVDVNTYAIYRSEEVHLSNSHSWKMDKADSVSASIIYGESTQDYKMVQGKLYLNYIKHHVELRYFNNITKAEIKKFSIQQDLLINDIHTENFVRPDNKRQMKNYSLQSQVKNYNPAFWKNYNVIKSTPLEKKIIEDLEQEGSLEEQFTDVETEKIKTKKNK